MPRSWLCIVVLALAVPAAAQDAVPAPPAPASASDGNAPATNYDSELPPPTAYDQLGQNGQPTLAPESFALVRQLGRVLIALIFTLTLVYLFFRLGLPRVMRLWLRQGDQSYFVRERLALDAGNTLVRIEHESGSQYLLGIGAQGIQLIDKLPAPPGGPLSSPVRSQAPFDQLLRPQDPEREP